MSIPENTSERDPAFHLLGAMSEGVDGYITGMEAAGQQQLVHSDRLPTDTRDGDEAYLALGFTFGPADSSDTMFRPATLPVGWRKEGSDHSMWSYVVDELGRRRVAIFYKAAFYDRSAFMRLQTVYSYASDLVYGGGEPLFDETWCTPEAFREALTQRRQENARYIEMYANRDDEYSCERAKELREERARIDALEASVPGGEGR